MNWKVERLRKYLEAEEHILAGQSYTLDGRSVTYADLSQIREGIAALEAEGITPNGVERKRRTMQVVYKE